MSYQENLTKDYKSWEDYLKENPEFGNKIHTFNKQNRFDFEFDLKFLQITPSLAINFHAKELEFIWIFFGIYFRYE